MQDGVLHAFHLGSGRLPLHRKEGAPSFNHMPAHLLQLLKWGHGAGGDKISALLHILGSPTDHLDIKAGGRFFKKLDSALKGFD